MSQFVVFNGERLRRVTFTDEQILARAGDPKEAIRCLLKEYQVLPENVVFSGRNSWSPTVTELWVSDPEPEPSVGVEALY